MSPILFGQNLRDPDAYSERLLLSDFEILVPIPIDTHPTEFLEEELYEGRAWNINYVPEDGPSAAPQFHEAFFSEDYQNNKRHTALQQKAQRQHQWLVKYRHIEKEAQALPRDFRAMPAKPKAGSAHQYFSD